MGPKRYNEWYSTLFGLSDKPHKNALGSKRTRQDWVKQVIHDIREEAKRTRNKSMSKLADFLEDKSRCQIIGFTPGYEYILAKNDGRPDWEKSFIHPTGQVCLFVKVKGLPVFMTVGATLKWGKSDLPVEVTGGTG